ncbi:hypothetical protein EJ08DRAFT_650918 [Tothia fuscella]|uniref:Uncharacterized protein n=1 Tax=Tothia fuscella TaxID=1048955 RepID=A0A9P4NNW5_9PEZI|nr:hypothetical protein EJ08DRAFT_650918 [Tothia fuscella]
MHARSNSLSRNEIARVGEAAQRWMDVVRAGRTEFEQVAREVGLLSGDVKEEGEEEEQEEEEEEEEEEGDKIKTKRMMIKLFGTNYDYGMH